jgi:biopolymer transport protein ExbB/TolQ
MELLARLRDLHPPAAPPWWPPAPGWWLLALLAVALLFFALRRAPAWWRRLRLRRRLLRALEASASPAEVSQLLRIAALERFPEANAAGLHGERWIAFLEARAPGRFAGLREAVTEAPYRADAADAAPLREAARGWMQAVL